MAPDRPALAGAAPQARRSPDATPGSLSVTLGRLPQLETLILCNGWRPRLCHIAPALQALGLVVQQDMLSHLQSLQHPPTLTSVMVDVTALQYPYQLPFFLPKGCVVGRLVTRFVSGDLAIVSLPRSFCPA